MKTVNIQEAKTHLSRLVALAAGGEEIVIARAGRPMVRLVAYVPDPRPRVLGGWQGRVRIADDFDAPSADVVALFEGVIADTER